MKKAVYEVTPEPCITNNNLESFQCGETIDSSMSSADGDLIGVRG